MAQLLSPVCTDALKFQNPVQRGVMVEEENKGFGRVRVATGGSSLSEAVADDYYAVLGLLPDATPEQVKKAYYNCMKACHPDLSGNDQETTNFCMFINDVYEVLSDPVQRMVYDEIHGYALTAINPFFDDACPKDHVFVDEFSCIGCKNCANVASDVFGIEEDFGRARVHSQCGKPEKVQQAIDSWSELWLPYCVQEKAKVTMMKQKGSDNTESYWSNLWGKPRDQYQNTEDVKERARRAAAAARRWREYSRRGADKPPTFKLPEALSNKEK
ncbi:DNAJ heat shock N-terminal domain-containing protein [Actinidia rufa]|uniref:DNAJ heat shock N-terminal domain-containing protein n=1 Tax=Actinidia rufa TaxID=165716 RepID=A0A7J0DYM6_9ERIC|nr:DNAJ heat shock N-terminal domain-containing protein [Actinidia rufa]